MEFITTIEILLLTIIRGISVEIINTLATPDPLTGLAAFTIGKIGIPIVVSAVSDKRTARSVNHCINDIVSVVFAFFQCNGKCSGPNVPCH